MLTTLLTMMLASHFRPCQATPVFEKHYYENYVPQTVETSYGLQVVAPNSPYIAAAGVNKLYFIDKRFDEETAFHIKQQIEHASIPRSGEYIKLDELEGTAEVRSSVTNETLFTFDPPYARVFFARGMNKHNPALKLVDHELPGHWVKAYDLGGRLNSEVPYLRR